MAYSCSYFLCSYVLIGWYVVGISVSAVRAASDGVSAEGGLKVIELQQHKMRPFGPLCLNWSSYTYPIKCHFPALDSQPCMLWRLNCSSKCLLWLFPLLPSFQAVSCRFQHPVDGNTFTQIHTKICPLP